MNDQATIETGTALALPEPTTLAGLLSKKGGIDPIVDQIAAHVRAEAAKMDPKTAKGREALKSLAHKVSKSKAEIERQADTLKEDAQKLVKAVNAEVNTAKTRCDALRDEIKKPALDWEAADEERKFALRLRLDAFRPMTVPASSADLRALIAEVEAVAVDATWQEFQTDATDLKALCLNRLDEHLAAAVERERIAAEAARQAEELAQLRAEKAARDEADRLAREAAEAEAARVQAAAAQAERERIEAEQARLARIAADKAEAELAARIEAEKVAVAQFAAEQAEARAKAEAARLAKEAAEREVALLAAQAEADERHKRELAEAAARTEAAAQAERDRLAAERRAVDEAAAKRAADQAHRSRIRDDIATSMNGFTDELTAGLIADAIMGGVIPHVEVTL